MNTFNKKSLYAAIAGIGALGVVGTADAVYVNADGLGQVLIYPYYTARTKTTTAFGATQFNSLLSIVNSTGSAKSVKVRFLESLDSQEVLDFNLYLSAFDVWTTGVVPTSDGAGIVSADVSCTQPAIAKPGSAPTAFVNYAYSSDGGPTSLDRTREGYVEIIEMANINDDTATWSAVTHSEGSGGTPTCKGIGGTASSDYTTGNGGLFGAMTIINVIATAETSYDPTAIANWNTIGSLQTDTTSISPNLNSGSVLTSESFIGGLPVTSTWGQNVDAVSAALMHDTIMNEYILDSATRSGTDWIVTFPTKRYYVAPGKTGAATPPFQNNFKGNSCDEVFLVWYDREENHPSAPPGGFSPPPPGNPPNSLCYEANVVTFANSNVFASPVSANVPTTYQNGWMVLDLVARLDVAVPYHQMTSATHTYNGLPVIGFSTSTFFNGGLPTVCNAVPPATCPVTQSAYGGSYKHKATSN
jgi:hypothetical protein